MTSAINGRIIYKQADRSWLNANIRSNSLAFDLTNNILLYSPSGTDYYEFYPGQTSGGSVSALQWNNILNKPIASISTSGVLTNADWVLFNGKADASTVSSISAIVAQLVATSGSGISAVTWNIVQGVPIASISTSGVLSVSDYNKFNNKADVSAIPVVSGYALNSSLNNYYPTSSTGNISGLTSPAQTQINTLSGTVAQLVATSGSGGVSAVTWDIVKNVPVASISTSGVLSVSDYNKFNNKADVSAIPVTSGLFSTSGGNINGNVSANNISATNLYGNISSTNVTDIIYQTLILKSSISSTPSATFSDLIPFKYNVTPNILNLIVSASLPTSSTANYNIYTTVDNIGITKIAYGNLTSATQIDSSSIINLFGYNKFCADISVSGTPNNNIVVYVKS